MYIVTRVNKKNFVQGEQYFVQSINIFVVLK